MNYIVIPKSITQHLTGNNRCVDIYVWAYIRLCSNFKTNISHITEEKLSKLTNIPLRTVGQSIKRLKDANCLEVRTRITDGCKKQNSYHFKTEKENYFLIDNSFFHRGYDAKIAGFMLLLRSICLNNTNKALWSKIKIAEEIGLSRNTTTKLLNECQTLGLIKTIPNGFEITEDSLKYTAINNKVKSPIYQAICDFCESKGATPPTWNKNAMSVIHTKYNLANLPLDNEMNILYQLNNRCKQLPKEVSLSYFIKALGLEGPYRTLVAQKEQKAKNEYSF